MLQQPLSGVHIILIRSSDKNRELRILNCMPEKCICVKEKCIYRETKGDTHICAAINKAHVTIQKANRRARTPGEAL